MLTRDLLEGYDKEHKCLTPGAKYRIVCDKREVSISVNLPKRVVIDVSEKQAIDLEAELHYAVEKVLARFFEND